jgi:hypothetical protein
MQHQMSTVRGRQPRSAALVANLLNKPTKPFKQRARQRTAPASLPKPEAREDVSTMAKKVVRPMIDESKGDNDTKGESRSPTTRAATRAVEEAAAVAAEPAHAGFNSHHLLMEAIGRGEVLVCFSLSTVCARKSPTAAFTTWHHSGVQNFTKIKSDCTKTETCTSGARGVAAESRDRQRQR